MGCNSRIFLCYRNNNVDIAKKLFDYINNRNIEENLNFERIWFSNGEVECNYLYDAIEGIQSYDHIIFLVDNKFTDGFMTEDNKINDNCITAKEILSIAQKISKNFIPKDYHIILPHMYCINVGEGQQGTFSDNGKELAKYLSSCNIDLIIINLFLKLGENHIVRTDFIDNDFHIVFKRVLDRIIDNIHLEMSPSRYLSFYENGQAYRTLPEAKIINCIFAKGENYNMGNTKNAKILIHDFKALFIDKKVYKYHVNDDVSDRVYDFKKNILQEDSILIGNAGCGKSTLLFNTYIELVEHIKNYKILPIFVDLNSVTVEQNLVSCIEKAARFYLPKQFNLVDVYKELNLKGYQCLLILDSLDECKVGNIQTQLASLRQSELFLNKTKMEYKICVGLRVGRFESLDDDIKNEFRKYSIRDFDKSDVDLYVERLIKINRIKYDQCDSIQLAVELLTYTDKINPFLLSMIIQPYVNSSTYQPKTFKMIDLLYTSVISLMKKVNLNRGDAFKDVNQKSLMIIGMYGVLGNVDHLGNPYSFFNVDTSFSEKEFDEDKYFISNNTYLINREGTFYQKIFSDFFAAKYIYENLNRNNINRVKYFEILKYFFTSFKFKELFEFIILLADKDTEKLEGNIDYSCEKINIILDLMMEHMDEKTLFYNIKSMLNVILRYSSKKILKDALPIELYATFHPDQLIIYLLERYFKYLCEKNLINFGYFYNVISGINRYDLAMTAIYNIVDEVEEQQAFKMLSIYRDSYLILKYNGKSEILQCEYPKNFDKTMMAVIYKKATNHIKYPKVINMPLRECLNAAFYANEKLFNGVRYIDYSKKNPAIHLKYNYFPYIYNLELFMANPILQNNKEFKIVSEEDQLFFNSGEQDFAIQLLDLNDLNQGKDIVELDEDVQSVFIYSNPNSLNNFIPNCISKRHNFLSLHISDGIEEIEDSAFLKSENLRNVYLPKTLKRIHSFAFCHCDRLEEFRLPEGLIELGESVVEDCPLLEKIVFPKSLKNIGNYLFEQCSSLQSVDFQSIEIDLPDGLFVGCQSLNSIEELHLNKQIKEFPMLCFSAASKLSQADLTSFHSLESIRNYCFYDCACLEEVIFPASLQYLGMCVFYECLSLKRVVFHSVPTISSQIFAGLNDNNENHVIEIVICDKKTRITKNEEFSAFVLSLGGQVIEDRFDSGFAFERKEDGTYNLGYSFNRMDRITSLFDSSYFANKGIRISSFTIGAMGDHDYLNDIILDENLKEAAEWMFEDCQSLFNVKLGKTKIRTIEKHMFENCEALTEISLPATITEIKEYAFENCINLTTIHFIKNCYDSCSYKKSERDISLCIDNESDVRKKCIYNGNGIIYIPCNVTYIGDYAFHNCKSIKTIYYNGKTTRISPLATYETNCKLIRLDDDEVFE